MARRWLPWIAAIVFLLIPPLHNGWTQVEMNYRYWVRLLYRGARTGVCRVRTPANTKLNKE